MQFLTDYMNASERENAIFEAQMNRESIALDNKWNALMQEHTLQLADIDLSIALERYSDDDAQALFEKELATYMEAVKDWWKSFKEWIRNLVNKLCGKPSDDETAGMTKAKTSNDEIELPCNPDEAISTVKRFTGMVKNHMKYKKEDGSWDKTKIAADAAGVSLFGALLGGTGVAIANVVKKTKIKAAELEPKKKEGDEALIELSKAVDALPETDTPAPATSGEGEAKESGGENILKTYATKIISFFRQYFLDPIKNFFKKLGKGDGSAENKEETKALPEGEHKGGETKTDDNAGTETPKKEGDDNIAALKAELKAARKGIGDKAQPWGVGDRRLITDAKKTSVSDLKEIVKKLREKSNANSPKNKEAIDKFADVLKRCEDAGITEFTHAELFEDEIPMFEATMTPIDDSTIERELMLMTESEESEVNEFIELVDSL